MRAKALVVLGLSLIAAGCYESATPLSPASEAIADTALVGTWSCVSPTEPDRPVVRISESRPREYAIELTEPGKKGARLRGFVTRTGPSMLLNLQQVGASDLISANRYAFVRYAYRPDKSVAMDWLKERTSSGDVFEPLLRCARQSR